MSYILDALRKAERERSLARVPTLTTVHAPARKPRWPIGVFAICGGLAVCAAVTIWVILLPPSSSLSPAGQGPVGRTAAARPVGPPDAEPGRESARGAAASLSAPLPAVPGTQAVETPDGASAPSGSGPQVGARPDLALPRSVPVPGEAGRARAAAPPTAGLRPSEPRRPDAVMTAPVPAERPLEKSARTETPLQGPPIPEVGSPSAGAPPPAPPPAAAPATLQEAMAKMTVNVLVYTQAAADRMVTINGKQYVQGDYVEGRYRVEEITREGAVLSYQGERALLHP